MERAFPQNLYEHDVKFPFATVFGGRKHRNQFNFFSESEIGCGPQDPVLKFTYICHFKRDERKARKSFFLKNKTNQQQQQQQKKPKKTGIHFDSWRRFRCPRRASSYDQMRKRIG